MVQMVCPDFNLGDFWVNQMLIFRASTWVVRQHILKPISFVSMRPWVRARCLPFQYQRGWSYGGSILGLENVWTAYSVKADGKRGFLQLQELDISEISEIAQDDFKFISSFLFCCFFVPFFYHSRTFSFRPLEQKKKVRWNLSLLDKSIVRNQQ